MVLLGLLACGGNDATQTTQQAAETPATEANTGENTAPVKNTEGAKAEEVKVKKAATLETTNAEATTDNTNNTENTVKETK